MAKFIAQRSMVPTRRPSRFDHPLATAHHRQRREQLGAAWVGGDGLAVEAGSQTEKREERLGVEEEGQVDDPPP